MLISFSPVVTTCIYERLLKYVPFRIIYKWKFNTQRVEIKCLKAKGCLKSGVEMEAETV